MKVITLSLVLLTSVLLGASSSELPVHGYTWGADNKNVVITPSSDGVLVYADVSASPEKEIPILAIARPDTPLDMSGYDEVEVTLIVKSGAFMRFSIICLESKSGAKFLYEYMPKVKTGEVVLRVPFSKLILPPWGKGKKAANDTTLDRTSIAALYIGGVLGKPDISSYEIRKVRLIKGE